MGDVLHDRFTSETERARDVIQQASTADDLTPALQIASSLRAELVAAYDGLPTYERKSYEQRISQLLAETTAKRATLQQSRGRFRIVRPAPRDRTQQVAPVAKPTPAAEPAPVIPAAAPMHAHRRRWAGKQKERYDASSDDIISAGGELHLDDLTSCLVDLRTLPASLAVQVRSAHRSILLLGEVQGSVMFHSCSHCLVVLSSARQLRIHDTVQTTFAANVASKISIEGCRALRFAGDKSDVQDFDHVLSGRTSADANPNWTRIAEEEVTALVERVDKDWQAVVMELGGEET